MTPKLAVLALALAASVAVHPAAHAAEAGWSVPLVQVTDRKAVIATVQTLHEVTARARLGGTVAKLSVAVGDRVAAGDRLATVVDEKLGIQVQAINAHLQAQQAERDQARLDAGRAEELRRAGTIPQTRLDEARTRLDIAERTLKAMRAERDVVLQQAAEGAVLAPGEGRVLQVPVTEGSVVLSGDTVAKIATNAYVLRLQLPERHAGTLKAGDAILVGARGLQPEATPEKLRQGRVVLVYPEIEQGRVVADVEVDRLDGYFVGERTRVYVPTGARPALVVPADLVYRRYGVSYVRLLDGTEVVVQVGMPTADGLEILAGLRQGDVVGRP